MRTQNHHFLSGLLIVMVSSYAFGQQAPTPGKRESVRYRTIGTLAGLGGGFALGLFVGLAAFDDAINSDRKVWTTTLVSAAGGAVGGYFLGRAIDKRKSRVTWIPDQVDRSLMRSRAHHWPTVQLPTQGGEFQPSKALSLRRSNPTSPGGCFSEEARGVEENHERLVNLQTGVLSTGGEFKITVKIAKSDVQEIAIADGAQDRTVKGLGMGALFGGVGAAGGVLEASDQTQADWNNLRRLRDGDRIELVEMSLKRHEGTFAGFSDQAISLRTDQGEITVSREQVMRLSLKERSNRARNALIGAAIGAAIGLTSGVVWCHGDCDLARGIAWGLPMALGAGVGTGIGALFPGYETLYGARKP